MQRQAGKKQKESLFIEGKKTDLVRERKKKGGNPAIEHKET